MAVAGIGFRRWCSARVLMRQTRTTALVVCCLCRRVVIFNAWCRDRSARWIFQDKRDRRCSPLGLVIGRSSRHIPGRPENRDSVVLVSLCVFSLALTLWVGTNWGSILRITADEYERSEEYLNRRAYTEKSVRTFRESLGLPAEPPVEGTQQRSERSSRPVRPDPSN